MDGNFPPWPVTGPEGDNVVSEADSSFFLEIRDDENILMVGNSQFDPDGDTVTFDIALVSIDNPSLNPDVSVSPDGEFTVTWDSNFTDAYVYAYYQITTNDGSLSTPPTIDISIFLY